MYIIINMFHPVHSHGHDNALRPRVGKTENLKHLFLPLAVLLGDDEDDAWPPSNVPVKVRMSEKVCAHFQIEATNPVRTHAD